MTAKEVFDELNTQVKPTIKSFGDFFATGLDTDETEDLILNALLNSIPKEEMDEFLKNEVTFDYKLPLIEKIRWYVQRHPDPEPIKNESVNVLLKKYLDKKSKQVQYARTELTKRFPYQSFTDQRRILKSFLTATKKDRQWAGKILRERWDPYFESMVKDVWKSCHDSVMASVILRHLPASFILDECDQLSVVASYAKVCARIGKEPMFTIDWTRLSIAEEFYVRAKLGLSIDEDKAFEMFQAHLISIDDDFSPTCCNFCNMKDIRSILWSLGKMGMSKTLLKIWEFQKIVKSEMRDNKETTFFIEMKRLLGCEVLKEWYEVLIPKENSRNDTENDLVTSQKKNEENLVAFLSDKRVPDQIKEFVREMSE